MRLSKGARKTAPVTETPPVQKFGAMMRKHHGPRMQPREPHAVSGPFSALSTRPSPANALKPAP